MKLCISKSLFTKTQFNSSENDEYLIRLIYKIESRDSDDVWICAYRNYTDLSYKYFDSNFTIPSHLKFAGFFVYTKTKFDINNIEKLNIDFKKHTNFYLLTFFNDSTDYSSLNESFSCYNIIFNSEKPSSSTVPLENIVWVDDDDLEFKNRSLSFLNVSLLLFSKLPSNDESETIPFENEFKPLDKLPNDLKNDVLNAIKYHSLNLNTENESVSVTYSDPFEPPKDNFSQFYSNYTLGFGFDSRDRNHALVVSGEYEDTTMCLKLLLQTNVSFLPDEIIDEEIFNKLLLSRLTDLLTSLYTVFENDPGSMYCYVSNVHSNDDELVFKIENDEPEESEVKQTKTNKPSNKKSSGKGKGSKSTSKVPQVKKLKLKKTAFTFLSSLCLFGSRYYLNFDSKTGCLSLSLNKDYKEPDNNSSNKKSVNIVFKFVMSSTTLSQDYVSHGGATLPLFNYLSEPKASLDGLLEAPNYKSYLKFVFNPYEVVDRTILISPHRSGNAFPPWISPKKSSVYTVEGNYQYYHYTQCGVNDTGWGCCYRSLQLVCSWYLLQYRTPKLVPSHSVIQQVLKDNDISHKDLKIGSSTWIGTIESGYFLNWYLGYTYKTLYLNDVSEFRNYNVVIADHFKNDGTPIIVGAGAYAYVILGICLENEGGEVAYLIADPHYTGDDSVKNVLTKGGIGWKKIEFLSKASDGKFINLCLPQLEEYCA